MKKEVWVVMILEEDEDAPFYSNLQSCAVFSTWEKAKAYVNAQAKRYEDIPESEREYEVNSAEYCDLFELKNIDTGHVVKTWAIVSTDVDEFEQGDEQ